MADKPVEKKDMKTEITFLLVGLFLLGAVTDRIYRYYLANKAGLIDSWAGRFLSFLVYGLWPLTKVFLALASFVAVVGIFYIYKRLKALNEEEQEMYGAKTDIVPEGVTPIHINGEWEHIIELINSVNQSDWRLAIIEADVMLEDMMRRAGYSGDTLGEMLKSVEKSDFTTIDAAWEAHKVRNAIAHQGREFQLNEREAKHAIALYEDVFKEFKMI